MTKSLKPKKYRPVLTAASIAHILALAKNEKPLSAESLAIISSLSPFLAKIENAGIQAAYTEKPDKESLADSLGFSSPSSSSSSSAISPSYTTPIDTQLDEAVASTKEAYWAECYRVYLLDPAYLTLEQIQAAHEHMYLEDLFTPEQKAKFEAGEL